LNVQERSQLAASIFNEDSNAFVANALEVYYYQQSSNPVYAAYLEAVGRGKMQPSSLREITPIPISFFKSHAVKSFGGNPEIIFTSSGTTGAQTSRHFVKELSWYEACFMHSFKHFYGNPEQYAFLCLLPSYLERSGSSLVYMAEKLVKASGSPESGFFLQANEALFERLQTLAASNTPTILLGVTFALLDFAARYKIQGFDNLIVMETGGMKGRGKEMLREEMHQVLMQAFDVSSIHSEYGMTELMSQAYSFGGGVYQPPPWMKVLVRSEDDPLEISESGSGLLTIFDVSNIDSCAFIETEDVGRVHANGNFEVLGRLDNSDIRGCSLLVV
jgi:hypothetical protein